MKDFIKKIYGSIAGGEAKSCCGGFSPCCPPVGSISEKIGYTEDELASIPREADMGLGCGNPTALASLEKGEVVVDLGSGGGIDAFLAAGKVGESGRVIGIDMTKEMVEKARENAGKAGFRNVEFRLGDIENIPLDDGIADCVISNCVINLAGDKQKVFNGAFRVLKPGGRLMIADMVLLKELPEEILRSAEIYAGCISGALEKEDYLDKIRRAGFGDIRVVGEDRVKLLEYAVSDEILKNIIRNRSSEEIEIINDAVVSIKVSARK